MQKIVVIGAGTMGNGIAHTAAASGFNTTLVDVSQDILERAVSTISANLQRGVDSVPKSVVATSFRERSPSLSPDGKWLAYASDETGRFEVFVRPFPDAQSAKWQVSTDGGSSPHWSAQGNELFYLDAANQMQSAHVTTSPSFGIASKERLFSASGYFLSPWGQAYDVTPDGQRFLMLRVGTATGAMPVSLVLVENFLTELRQRTAAR